MEDLAGLNFTTSSSSSSQPKSAPPNQSRFPQSTTTFAAPVPSRGISSNYHPANLRNNTPNGNTAKTTTTTTSSKIDSFAALSAFSGISRVSPSSSNASLEQQRLAKEKERREAIEKEKRDMQMHFGADEFWEKHSRQNTPTITTTDMSYCLYLEVAYRRDDVDLSAFSSDAPVNTATHFPPPKEDVTNDPFDMSAFGESLSSRTRYHTSPGHLETTPSTDDILGVLSQPVESFRKPSPPPAKPATPAPPSQEESDDEGDTERDRAIAAIVEMGFTVGQATKALATTPSGADVELALNNLLSRPSSSASSRLERPPAGRRRTPDPARRTPDSARRTPDSSARHHDQPAQKDLSQIAGEMGTSLLKGAGSLWKSGRDKMNTLIQEYQGEQPDPNVPKWMRDQQRYTTRTRREDDKVTDERRALEIQERPRSQQRPHDVWPSQHHESLKSTSARDRLAMKKQAEEEADMGYRSSARRRVPPRTRTPSSEPPSRTATPPVKPTPVGPEVDLFSSTIADIPTPISRTSTPQTSTPTKPPKPSQVTRSVPPASSTALSSSHTARQKGSESFKLGDYTQALTYYTSALTPLPESHPQRIIILSNRAITNLKLGDAKAAILDCDTLLAQIGPSKGEGEKIADVEGEKSMRDIWEKGILRRAQGLETLEKYNEALEMWKVAVDAGVGGGVALDGRRRCEKALGVKAPSAPVRNGVAGRPPSKPIARPVTKTAPKPARQTGAGPSASESLAKYHADLAVEDKEKADLYDVVDTKVTTWYNGKETNLRALLSSLDLILWPEAGWKKVNMAELVLPPKVKVIYMKAIAKVHPDKVRDLRCGLM